MGTHCSSELYRGHIFKSKTTIMKLLLLTVFVAVALAEEAAEEAKPAAPAAVVPVHHPFYGLWGHQLQWPSFRAPGFSSQCFGCRLGKRSADAEADAEPGYYGYPYGFYGYPYGYRYHAYGPGIAGHPSGTSYVHRSPQGIGK